MKALQVLGVAVLAVVLTGADWPQWRGPNRDGVSSETGLLKQWPAKGPKLAWSFKNAGSGYSTPAVVGDRVYLSGARGDAEYLFALDAKNGQELWSVKLGPVFTWQGNNWNAGPNATPTVDGNLVFALSGLGELVCADTQGKEVWRKNLPRDLGAEVNPLGGGPEKLGWGYSWCPLVDGDQLICVPGGPQGLLAALNKKTGDVLWRSKEVPEQAPYSSPLLADFGGVRQVVQMTYDGVLGVASKDGKLLWYYKHTPSYDDVLIPTPLIHDGHVFLTAGHGGPSVGCDLVKVTKSGDKFTATKVYANKNMANEQGGVVRVGDHVYGFSKRPRPGWACVDWKTGAQVWTNGRKLTAGSLVVADGHLYCYGEEEGTVALVEASPAKPGWNEKGRFDLPEKSKLRKSGGKFWTPPVIANGRLYLRDQDLLFCYEIK